MHLASLTPNVCSDSLCCVATGVFAAMVDDTGPATAAFLRSVAAGASALV